jgi:hypothetical protein
VRRLRQWLIRLTTSVTRRHDDMRLREGVDDGLGASRADVVFRRGMAIVLQGITAGVAACVIAGPYLAHLLYGVSPRDPLAIAAGPAVLIVVGALAISLPARRAMQQDPVIALRAE